MSQTPLVTGMILGGVVISAVGAASTYFVEGKNPAVKSVGRDFVIGSVMVLMIMQLLPESSTSVVDFFMGLIPLTLFQTPAVTTVVSKAVEEMEVKVGVPQF
jgi:hypothetical protein